MSHLSRSFKDDLLEDLLEFENMTLQDQVQDFEHWDEMNRNNNYHPEEQVICPICQRSNLCVNRQQVIECPDESCSFRLTVNKLMMTDRPLPMLREQLRRAFEEHSEGCSELLSFQSMYIGTESVVVGNCSSCGQSFNIL
jgi:hypothetical protein